MQCMYMYTIFDRYNFQHCKKSSPGWIGGWMEVKGVLRNAYQIKNQCITT